MNEKLKKFLITLLVLLTGGTGYIAYDQTLGNGGNQRIDNRDIIGTQSALQSLDGSNNTTTDTWFVGDGFNQVNLHLAVNASSTEDVTVEPYFSSAIDCMTGSDVRFFSPAQLSVSGAVVTVSSATTTYAWTQPAAGRHERNIEFNNVATRCMRTITYTDNNTAAPLVWLQAVMSND